MKTYQRPSISTMTAESVGGAFLLAASSSQAFPATNDALFVPITLYRPVLVKRLFAANGSAVSGNIDLGIYTSGGSRIVSKGSTAQAGTQALQFLTPAALPLVLTPGNYYMAVAMDNTTGTLRRCNQTIIRQQMMGVYKMASAFPLPATATFATVTATHIPMIGLEVLGVL